MNVRALTLLVAIGCSEPAPETEKLPERGPVHGLAVPGAARYEAVAAPITYHGGSLLTWDVPIYLIYYGYWAQNGQWTAWGPTAGLIEDFVGHVGGSNWFAINSGYTDRYGQRPPNALHFGGRAFDFYSRGTQLGDADVLAIVEGAIAGRQLPSDPWGLYVVLPTSDIGEGDFCRTNCGWHTYAQSGQTWLKYIFVGNPGHCPNVCPAYNPSANGAPEGDGMVNVLAHELSESVTDPYINAWYDASGQENADKCAWNFGPAFQLSNGGWANVWLGDRYYLLQENWVPANPGYCSLSGR